ncbi:uncharacterized protein LOC114525266 [Dendronephthya gigantea]|uniref:uncharacterized protein LOC114525266 n=1 Tax=Dendronephthya gigantea TaxID=151771 RepID=UPI0010695082|nr:uncharacterized protein LOC114525266 [Dendronephthya gigantea]
MNLDLLYAASKIAYYVLLILYHGVDLVMDWYSFNILLTNGTISGVPADSITVRILFGFSCAFCTIFTAALFWVYANYIKYHFLCAYVAVYKHYGPLGPAEGSESIQIPDETNQENVFLFAENGQNTIKPRYILAELFLSVAELVLKDDIQSGLLFWVSRVFTFTHALSWHSLLFSLCSIVAHLKLFICFATKLFRLGEGEAGGDRRWDFKCVLCVFGCLGSAIFEGLTVSYLVKALKA